MKMAAAAGNGDEQVRIEGSTAHDPADGIDSFSLRVTNFSSQSSAHAAEHRTSKLRRGYGCSTLQSVIINRKDYYGRNCNPHFMFRRGNVSLSASMCEGPHAGDPRRARYQL